MTTRTVEVCNTIGLCAGPAAFFIQQACSYTKTTIWVEKGDRHANAKSLLGVLSLGACKGEKLLLRADGGDEVAALDGLEDLLKNRLENI